MNGAVARSANRIHFPSRMDSWRSIVAPLPMKSGDEIVSKARYDVDETYILTAHNLDHCKMAQ